MAEIRLTTGGIGTGKSYKNVKDAYEELQKGDKCKYKQIYSNIRAHAELCPGITLLPDDWRECEKHSLIIIDECQKHEKFSKHFSNRRDSEIVDLTMIRHNHCDMWLISPNPTLVNKDVRDLVNVHVCLEANGAKTAKAYCFDKVQLNLSKAVKLRAFDEFTYSIEEKYYKLYKSTEDGEPSRRTYNVNIKLISFIAGLLFVVLIICALVYWLTSSAKKQVDTVIAKETKSQPVDNNKVNVDPMGQGMAQANDLNNKIKLCVEQFQWTTEQCRQAYDKQSEQVRNDNLVQSTGNSMEQVVFKYNPSKPYETVYEGSPKPTDFPKFSGCMKQNGRYVAYTQQGTILKDVSSGDCQRLIDQNDRPFNYFASENRPSNSLAENTTVSNGSI